MVQSTKKIDPLTLLSSGMIFTILCLIFRYNLVIICPLFAFLVLLCHFYHKTRSWKQLEYTMKKISKKLRERISKKEKILFSNDKSKNQDDEELKHCLLDI